MAEPDYEKQYKENKWLALYALEQTYKVLGLTPYLYNFWQPG